MIISKRVINREITEIAVNGRKITAPVYSFDSIVVGSGAAGLNASDLIAAGG